MFDNLDDPRVQAQLAMAFGLLGGKGKGAGATLQNIGQAGLLGLNRFAVANEDKRRSGLVEDQRKMQAMQLAELQRGQDWQSAMRSGYRPGAPASPAMVSDDFPGAPYPAQPAQPESFDFSKAMAIDPFKTAQAKRELNKIEAPISVPAGGALVDAVTKKPIFTNEKPRDAWIPLTADEARSRGLPNNGQGFQRNSVTNEVKAIGSAPPVTNVNVNADKGYATTLAEGLAKQDLAAIDAAKSAPMRLKTARDVKAALDRGGLITGIGAEQRVTLEKVFAQAGLVGNDRVANTEQLASLLANQTLDAIKTSGLGSGQGFTDKDRQFLQDAAAGRITLEAKTIRRIAVLNELAASHHISVGNKVLAKIRKTRGFENFTIDDVQPMPEVTAPPPASAQSGGLSPSEAEELARLRAQFGKR